MNNVQIYQSDCVSCQVEIVDNALVFFSFNSDTAVHIEGMRAQYWFNK